MAEQVIIDVKTSGGSNLEALNKLLKNTSTNAADAKKSIDNLRNSLSNSRQALSTATQGTEEYAKALSNATKAANELRQANSNVISNMANFGGNNIGKNMSASFIAVEGVLESLGREVSDVTNLMLNLTNITQSALATTGISSTVAGFNTMRGAIASNTIAASELNNTLSRTTVEPFKNIDISAQKSRISMKDMNDEAMYLLGEVLQSPGLTDTNLFSYIGIASQDAAELARASLNEVKELNKELSKVSTGETPSGNIELLNSELKKAEESYKAASKAAIDLKVYGDMNHTTDGLKTIISDLKSYQNSLDPTSLEAYNGSLEETATRIQKVIDKLSTDAKQPTSLFNESKASILDLNRQLTGLEATYNNLSKSQRDDEIATYKNGQSKKATAEQVEASNSTLIAQQAKIRAEIAQTNSLTGKATSGYNGLGMAISQVGRELPNFFISSQIGFMAISNNLPILVDELKRAKEAGTSLGGAMKSALGGMNGWILLITAAMLSMDKIINLITEALDNVPKEIKVNIEIEEGVYKQLATVKEKILKFQLDYNRARESGNTKELDYLSTYANKEFGIHKDKLSHIMETAASQKAYFDAYLKMAENTYYNEAIIKKKAELQMQIESAKSANQQLSKIYGKNADETLKKAGGRKNMGVVRKFVDDVLRTGAEQQIADNADIINEANKALSNLPKYRTNANYFNVDTTKPQKQRTGGGSTSSAPTKKFVGYNEPKTVDYEAEIMPNMDESYKKANGTLDEFYYERKAIIKNYRDDQTSKYKSDEKREIDHNLAIEEARRADITAQRAYLADKIKEQTKNVNDIYPLRKKEYEDNEDLLKDNILSLKVLYGRQANLKDEYQKAEDKKNEDISKAKNKAKKKSINDQWVLTKESLDRSSKENDDMIKSQEAAIKTYKEKRKVITDQMEKLKDSPELLREAQAQLKSLDVLFDQSLENSVENLTKSTKYKLSKVQEYLDSFGSVTSAITSLYQSEADSVDSTYDAEEERINSMNTTDENRTKLLEENENARYEQKKKLFEKQKLWEEATAWINFASGSVAIWKSSINELGVIAGPIVAGIEQAALLATTVANVKSIRAQRIDSPTSSSSSSGASVSAVALAPSKTATTTKEDVTMGNTTDSNVNVVLVSDINKVQTKVSVRDSIQNY